MISIGGGAFRLQADLGTKLNGLQQDDFLQTSRAAATLADAQAAKAAQALAERKLADAEAALKLAKEEAGRATTEAERAKADAQAARGSEATAKRKLADVEAARVEAVAVVEAASVGVAEDAAVAVEGSRRAGAGTPGGTPRPLRTPSRPCRFTAAPSAGSRASRTACAPTAAT